MRSLVECHVAECGVWKFDDGKRWRFASVVYPDIGIVNAAYSEELPGSRYASDQDGNPPADALGLAAGEVVKLDVELYGQKGRIKARIHGREGVKIASVPAEAEKKAA